MDISPIQALETILRTDIAVDRFRIQAYELNDENKTRLENENVLNLAEVEKHARALIETIDNAEAAGLMNPARRFFHRSSAVELVSQQRWIDGCYDSELAPINARIYSIRAREGLSDEEDWPTGERPEDYIKLNEEYSRVLDAKLEETLREFGLSEMADLHQHNFSVYKVKREEGRRLIFGDAPDLELLESIQKQFESEAESCAKCGAFNAASVMIGSAVEAALLYMCLKHKDDAVKAKKRLPRQRRPKRDNIQEWGLIDLTLVAEEAGWLHTFTVDQVEILKTSTLIKKINRLRNLVHPGRHLTNKGALDVKGSYEVSKASYVFLRHLLSDIQTS